jgi:hypothetical protein
MPLTYFVAFLLLLISLCPLCFLLAEKIRKSKKLFICRHSFPLDISFELVDESWSKRFIETFIWSEQEMRIGYREFDDNVYISSDIQVIKTVLRDAEIRNLVVEIIKDPKIAGIYVADQEIRLLTKGISPKDTRSLYTIEGKYDRKVKMLRTKLVDAFKVALPIANKDNLNFSKDVQKTINKIEAFYLSLLFTSTIFLFYFCIFDYDPYLYLEGFSFKQIIFTALSLFIPVVFFVLWLTRYTVRRHLLIYKTICGFFTACLLTAFFILYHLNIYWDTSAVSITTENIQLEKVRGRKNTNYYLNIINPQNEELAHHGRISISSYRYNSLMGKQQVQFSIRKGYFNAPYFWVNDTTQTP